MKKLTKLRFSERLVKIKLLLVFGFSLLGSVSQANNCTIGLPVVDQTAKTVTFTVAWNNSWNIAGTGAPNNWDAIWLFIKWKDCASSAAIPFTHGTLSGLNANRTIPATLEVMSTVNKNGTNNAAGVNTVEESVVLTGLALDYTEGIMVRRAVVGTGTMAAQTIVLNVPGLPAAATQISLNVYGIEMVYVPKGDFTLGDGDGAATAQYSFMTAATYNTGLPQTVTNAFETGASTFYINNVPALGATSVAAVPAAWPKGQCGFYMMKHEISQGQYAEFLNTLATGQLALRLPTAGAFSTNRHRLQITTTPYSSDRPDRAMNYMSANDLAAYCDWACLRPATETEFEKACRGNGSTRGEFAWGNTTSVNTTTFAGAGTENGTETVSAGNVVYNASTMTNGDAGLGPLRCGIFATATSTRQESGASFYGILDLSGNMAESVINLHTTPASNVFTRSWGNGALSATGNHDEATWPAFGYVQVNATSTILWCQRGGSITDAIAQCQVSDRFRSWNNQLVNAKNTWHGGRAVR